MVATWKKDNVEWLGKEIKSHNTVGVVSINSLPSKQLQNMKRKLQGKVEIIVSRSNLINRALQKAGITGLGTHMKGPSGIILSNLNPFELERLVYSCRTMAPAKARTIAPFDLIVPEGDTGIPAGPVIGDLQAAGIKAQIKGGKIIIAEDSLVVKAGQPVSQKVAPMLMRLGIEPIEIVLRINAAYEKGVIYLSDVLHIDDARTIAEIADARRKAFNLAYNARIYSREVTSLLITEASCNARNLMINAKILNKETIGLYLGKADAAAKAIKSALPPELQAEL